MESFYIGHVEKGFLEIYSHEVTKEFRYAYTVYKRRFIPIDRLI